MLSTDFGRAAVIVLTGFIVNAAIAHEGAHGIIAVRMKAMKTMQQEFKAIGEMLVGKQPFDPTSIRRHAEILHENCHEIGNMFPPGSIDHHSHANSTIWKQPEVFQNELQKLHQASGDFVAKATAGDSKQKLRESFEAVGSACKSCHEVFRTADE
jgi:cytochrome c556